MCHVWPCKQLGAWMAARLDEHALFRRLSAAEAAADVAAGMLTSATEEGIKVARNSGQVHIREAKKKKKNKTCLPLDHSQALGRRVHPLLAARLTGLHVRPSPVAACVTGQGHTLWVSDSSALVPASSKQKSVTMRSILSLENALGSRVQMHLASRTALFNRGPEVALDAAQTFITIHERIQPAEEEEPA